MRLTIHLFYRCTTHDPLHISPIISEKNQISQSVLILEKINSVLEQIQEILKTSNRMKCCRNILQVGIFT